MAAFHDEELLPLEGEGEVAAPRATGTGRLGKAAILAVGLGLAAAGVYSASGKAPASTLRASSLAAVQRKDAEAKSAEAPAEPEPMVVEKDLGQFITASSLPESGLLGGSLADTIHALFKGVVDQSGVDKELTEPELEAFKYRFVAAMMGMEDSNQGIDDDFLHRARRHIQGAKPVMTKALAAAINARGHSFTVEMRDWMLDESQASFESRLIKVPFTISDDNKWRVNNGTLDHGLQWQWGHHKKPDNLPENFDSSEHWSKCKDVINNPHNQGRCGSCWVFGAMGPLDARMCIRTDGGYQGALSRGFGTSCTAQPESHDGCEGGWPQYVWEYIEKNSGIPSTGCVPYFGGSDYAHHWDQAMGAPKCSSVTACAKGYPRTLAQDYYKPSGVGNYQVCQKPSSSGIHQLKVELMTNGPVSYVLYANNAFMGYSGGVFSSGCEWFRKDMPNHAVQAIGFGKEDGKDYVLSLNSWGRGWGLGGRYKVVPCVVYMYFVPGPLTNLQFPDVVPFNEEEQ